MTIDQSLATLTDSVYKRIQSESILQSLLTSIFVIRCEELTPVQISKLNLLERELKCQIDNIKNFEINKNRPGSLQDIHRWSNKSLLEESQLSAKEIAIRQWYLNKYEQQNVTSVELANANKTRDSTNIQKAFNDLTRQKAFPNSDIKKLLKIKPHLEKYPNASKAIINDIDALK